MNKKKTKLNHVPLPRYNVGRHKHIRIKLGTAAAFLVWLLLDSGVDTSINPSFLNDRHCPGITFPDSNFPSP
jgi:hypothetical protein